jgi:dissimilatory sulfite reductase (desulfoviridin) alpha/beta subunit
MATAQVIYHRFFFVSSMHSFGVNVSGCPAWCQAPVERGSGI